MTREEIYNFLSNNESLKTDIRNSFKRPYTSVSTNDLNQYLSKHSGTVQSSGEEKKPKPEPVTVKSNIERIEEAKKVLDKMKVVEDTLRKQIDGKKLIASINLSDEEERTKNALEKFYDCYRSEIKDKVGYFLTINYFYNCWQHSKEYAITYNIKLSKEIIERFLYYLDIDIEETQNELFNLNEQFKKI